MTVRYTTVEHIKDRTDSSLDDDALHTYMTLICVGKTKGMILQISNLTPQ